MASDRDQNPFAPPSADAQAWMDDRADRAYVRGVVHGGLVGLALCIEIFGFICSLLGW